MKNIGIHDNNGDSTRRGFDQQTSGIHMVIWCNKEADYINSPPAPGFLGVFNISGEWTWTDYGKCYRKCWFFIPNHSGKVWDQCSPPPGSHLNVIPNRATSLVPQNQLVHVKMSYKWWLSNALSISTLVHWSVYSTFTFVYLPLKGHIDQQWREKVGIPLVQWGCYTRSTII